MKVTPRNKPMSRDRESLLALDKDALVDRLLVLEDRVDQLSDYVRDIITQKYGKKTERFEAPGQLLVFPGAAADDGVPQSSAAPSASDAQ